MAEALLNVLGKGRFRAFSAGSHPAGKPNPFALEKVQSLGISPDTMHSKSWNDFTVPDAPHMDIIITVCDNAAGEVCPIWPGYPATAHWSFPDPAAIEGSDDVKRRAFDGAFQAIRQRIQLLVELQTEQLEPLVLSHELKRIS